MEAGGDNTHRSLVCLVSSVGKLTGTQCSIVSKAYIDTFFVRECKYMHQKSKYVALTSDSLSYVHIMDKGCPYITNVSPLLVSLKMSLTSLKR